MSTTRSKPRLAKLKKPLGFQKGSSNSVLKETDSGFNPFVLAPTAEGNDFPSFSNGFTAFGSVNSKKNEVSGIRASLGDSTGFLFGANRNDFGLYSSELGGNEDRQKLNLGVGSKLGKSKDTSESDVILSSENGDTNSGAQCVQPQNVEFVFGENQKCFTSTSADGNKDKIDSVEKLRVDDTVKNENGVQKEVNNVIFVFGAVCKSSDTSTNSESLKAQAEVKVEPPSSGSHTRGMSEVLHGIENNGAFIFGKSFSQNYAFDKGVSDNGFGKPEKTKLSSKLFENSDTTGKNGVCYPNSSKSENVLLNNSANEKCEFVFGRSNVLHTTSVEVPIFKLPDEMSKLNINDPGMVSGTGVFKGSASADDSNRPENADAVGKTNGLNSHDFGASSTDRVENKDEINLKSSSGKSVPSCMDFGSEKWDPSSFKENLFSELNTKLEVSAKGISVHNRLKKTGRKFRQPSISRLSTWQSFVPHGSTCPENSESPGSPMDFSPYQETVASELCSGSNMKTSPFPFPENDSAPVVAHSECHADMKNGANITKKAFDISQVDKNCSETITVNISSDTNKLCRTSGIENGHPKSNAGTSVEAGAAASCDSNGHDSPAGVKFSLALGYEAMGERSFNFSASPSDQVSSTARRRQYRKKNRFKVSRDAFIISPRSNDETVTPSFEPSTSGSLHLHAVQYEKEDPLSSQYKVVGNDEHVEQRSITASAAIWEACDKWRLRGNQAYEKRELSEAEEFYTRGIRSVPRRERSGCFIEPLVLCFSNRAAARMSLGRIREALGDCMRATALDSNFLKVQIRAANCHLLLGELDEAIPYFRNCLKSGTDMCLDRRIVVEAFDGLQKAQKVAACTELYTELLQQRASDESNALTLIEEALAISPYSEKLFEIKAETLYTLQKYEEVIQLCEKTLTFAENVFSSVQTSNNSASKKANDCKNNLPVRRWRQRMISKSYFHLGRLEAALDILEKQGHLGSTADNFNDDSVDSPILLAVTIRELLHRKTAGNEAFQSGRYAEALEHYTAALSANIHSRPFTAVCFCNRAAAHQALGQIGDAIADCSLAIALDGNYSKAVSRRATLHEMIRDYAQAANDLQRYIYIIEKQTRDKSKGSDESKQTIQKELKQARRRLSSMEAQAKKDIPLNLYLILGIKVSDTASEVKKAYRKAALRHHPDKAGQFLARSESEDDGRLWKEIAPEVHKDTERLFKMIGEANAVLSDPAKRPVYDIEEETRKAFKSSNTSSAYKQQSEAHGYPFERRNWQDTWWKSHGSSYSRW